jgi:hypothetical protein
VLAYCSSAAPLFSLQSFYNYARGHCEAAQASNCSGVCWEDGMGGGGISAAGRGYNEVLALEVRNVG